MTAPAQDLPGGTSENGGLTIGELARRTGMNVPTLRMWEARHGFPVADRLPSGHRRYAEQTVQQVRQVLRRRDAGVRLDVAVAEVAGGSAPAASSVYAELRARHPQLVPYRLSKATLIPLTRALEDECCSRAQGGYLFGSFQREEFYRSVEGRWRDFARTNRGSWVLARFEDVKEGRPVEVDIPEDSAMIREWLLLCHSPRFSAALAAWELPGQEGTPDRQRLFESVWTLEPGAVRDAVRAVSDVVGAQGHDVSAVVDDLAAPGAPVSEDTLLATALFNRVVAYVDRAGRRRS